MADEIWPDRENRAPDGGIRKAHYGKDRQPWDDMLEDGMAAGFAYGSVLKYLRRPGKDPEHSRESAVRYYAAMVKRVHWSTGMDLDEWTQWSSTLAKLRRRLTEQEMRFLDDQLNLQIIHTAL